MPLDIRALGVRMLGLAVLVFAVVLPVFGSLRLLFG